MGKEILDSLEIANFNGKFSHQLEPLEVTEAEIIESFESPLPGSKAVRGNRSSV